MTRQLAAMREGFFIGVDGGGTRCRARLRDGAGRLLGEGMAGRANPRTDAPGARVAILAACREAVRNAGLAEADLARAWAGLGLAGVGQPADRDRVLAMEFPFAGLALDTDAYAACLGAHGGRDGAILILGTGSCGLALVGGRRINVGGWGYEVSDDGSGAWLGREAIRRSLWAHDGLIEAGPLSRAVMRRFDDSPERIVGWVRSAAPADYGALAPLVLDHAADGDPLARELAGEAAGFAARAIARLRAAGAMRICLVGGLADPLRSWLPRDVRSTLAAPEADATDGAILMAQRAALGNRV